jgi:hypothetical protein
MNELVIGKPLPILQHVEHLLLNLIKGEFPQSQQSEGNIPELG